MATKKAPAKRAAVRKAPAKKAAKKPSAKRVTHGHVARHGPLSAAKKAIAPAQRRPARAREATVMSAGRALIPASVQLSDVDILETFRSIMNIAPAAGEAEVLRLLIPGTPSLTASAVGLAALGTRLSPVPTTPLPSLRLMPVSVETSMDPRLQLAIVNRRTGKSAMPIASAAGDEVAVVARVMSASAWSELPDVHPGSTLGRAPDGSTLVTGRIPIDRIEAVRADQTVLSLKASQPVRPTLAATVQTMGVGDGLLPKTVSPKGGKGVVVGIVDTGGDFAHRNFIRNNGKTRLLALWNQAGVTQADSPFGYGRLFSAAQIDAALAAADPYAALGYGPRRDTVFEKGMHGTHVMDIVAGNGRGSKLLGVAPEADLIFVEISANDIAWQGPNGITQSFGDSVQMLEAIRFIFDTAGDRPCVVNLSLGTNGGPHDGTSLVEQGIDALVTERPNRAVVIAAGNAQLDGVHSSGQVPATGDLDLVWRVQENGGEFELWCAGDARLQLTLIGPDGTVVATVQPGQNQPLSSDGKVAIFISSRLDDPNNRSNVIGVWLAPGLPSGDWTLRFRSITGQAADYHAWIERLDSAQSSFVNPVPTHTLGSISTGRQSIAVGSYDAHKAASPVSSFSSTGPTRDGRNKPEISAPGGNVVAAWSRTRDGVTRKSGTSMAAPAVTGLIALMLAEAARNGTTLDSDALRARLLANVDKNPPASGVGVWDPQFGLGRASSKAI